MSDPANSDPANGAPAKEGSAGGSFARRLNLGCGKRFRDDWTNVDVLPAPGVLAHDLREPLPFADGAFDFVYHSHVLEHFRVGDAPAFLKECRRVLRPGGTLRAVVPDLEGIARGYLAALDRVDAADDPADRDAARRDLRWMTLELIDQTVRERSGGEMGAAFRSGSLPNEAFIRDRCGLEATALLDAREPPGEPPPAPAGEGSGAAATGTRSFLSRAAGALRRAATNPRELAGRALTDADREALAIGRFRLAGEVHQWMYDRIGLAAALEEAGFVEPRTCRADESRWDAWAGQRLDTQPDGRLYKPDSLFMEALNPGPGA